MEKFIIIFIAVLGVFVMFRRLSSIKKGEPTADELSSLILQKASSLSFYLSLYLWVVLSYFSDSLQLETDQLIGYGIIGMALIFTITWSIIKLLGLTK